MPARYLSYRIGKPRGPSGRSDQGPGDPVEDVGVGHREPVGRRAQQHPVQDHRARADHVGAARGARPAPPRSATVIASTRSARSCTSSAGERRVVDPAAVPVVAGPSSSAATVVTVPATPTSVGCVADVHAVRRERVERLVDRPGRGRRARPRSAGRRASAARSAGPSRCRASARRRRRRWPVAEDQLGGPAADVEHRDRERHARRQRRGWRRRRTARPPRRRRPPRARRRAAAGRPSTKTSALLGVPGRRGGARTAARRRRGRRRRAAYSSTAANTRSSASSASRPVRSTSCPSRTMRSSRTRLSWVPAAGSRSATSSLMVLVPQSTAATRVTSARRRRRPLTQGPAAQKSPSRSSTSSPSGFTPAALGERLAGEHVQALHPGRHAAGGDAGDLRAPRRSTRGRAEVGLVRARGTPRRARGRCPAGRSSPSSGRSASRVPISDAARGQVR